MKRRDFLRAAGGSAAAAATAATGVASAQSGNETSGGGTATATGTATGNESTGNESTGNETAGTATGAASGGGGGPTKTVEVGPGGSLVFSPGTEEPLQITPGTTVNFVWKSDNHNVVVDSQPDGANWEGTAGAPSKTYDTGHEYSHTFTTLGTYEYFCQPHKTAGMVGTIEVVETIESGGGGGEKDLEELGVPIQAHWVGSATILGIIVTIVYTFYILKYGESPNTGNTGGK